MNSAIIVAAGTGSRFGGDIPKQFVEVCGRTVLEHTLLKFQHAGSIDEIVLVLSADAIGAIDAGTYTSQFGKVRSIVPGGESRADSVRAGLEAVSASCQVVAVHDGARPLVSVDEIDRVLHAAADAGAACLVAAVTDTIKTVRGDEIAGTVNRSKLRRALTPQAFRVEVLRTAFEMSLPGAEATDESYLVEQAGHPVFAVEGSSRNIKVTQPDDLAFVRAILEQAAEPSSDKS